MNDTSSHYPDDAGESPHTALLGSQFVSFDEGTQTVTICLNNCAGGHAGARQAIQCAPVVGNSGQINS